MRRRLSSLLCLVFTAAWLLACATYISQRIGWSNLGSLSPGDLGGLMAGILAPVALLWVLITFGTRRSDAVRNREIVRG